MGNCTTLSASILILKLQTMFKLPKMSIQNLIAYGKRNKHLSNILKAGFTGFALVMLCVFPPIPGVEGTFEYALDAPWRIEPYESNGKKEYGQIPIQITIHDAMFSDLDNYSGANITNVPAKLGEFQKLIVSEGRNNTDYEITDLDEIEQTIGVWKWPRGNNPSHAICRLWKGDSPRSFIDIGRTSEWHATLWYKPKTEPKPGRTVYLRIELQIHNKVKGTTKLVNHVQILYGHEPLPKFSDEWLYGDLHYHSQGTDNEGESAYNYRGVIKAMGAMGLDFLFATEHASNAEQIVDADLDIKFEGLSAPARAKWQDLFPSSSNIDAIENAATPKKVLRDMNKARFDFNHNLLWQRDGVNQEANYRAFKGKSSNGIVPQIFLGGELDVIPEIDRFPTYFNLPYGTNLVYELRKKWREGWIRQIRGETKPKQTGFSEKVGEEYLLKDVQGINSIDYGREHLIYLPKTSQLTNNGASNFIASFTGSFGGATRRLSKQHPNTSRGKPPMLPEIERKGFAFLAHHQNASSGAQGPGSPPWTRHMLRQAWRSPAILGLQFWNENNRFISDFDKNSDSYLGGYEKGYERSSEVNIIINNFFDQRVEREDIPANDNYRHGMYNTFELVPFDKEKWKTKPTFDVEKTLHHGASSWDKMNRWGLYENSTKNLNWLKRGHINEPRKFFMAGGSDAHGDLNYRREGYFSGTSKVTSTAIGKPRNLVFVEKPKTRGNNPTGLSLLRRPSQEQIVESIQKGHYCITDGPALRIAIDMNNNNVIDAEDIPMGGTRQLNMTLRSNVKLLVEWKSTIEFGPIERIDLYVGTATSKNLDFDNYPRDRTYAPKNHGVRAPTDPISVPGDGYSIDPTNKLRHYTKLKSSEAYQNTIVINLDLNDYEAAINATGDRFYIRAFAKTAVVNKVSRYAFTNPVWIIDYTPILKATDNE